MERLSILMENDSSVALRLSLIALKSCVMDILSSYHSYIGIKVKFANCSIKLLCCAQMIAREFSKRNIKT